MICLTQLNGFEDWDTSDLRFACTACQSGETYEVYIHLDYQPLASQTLTTQALTQNQESSVKFDIPLDHHFLDTMKSFPPMVVEHLQYFTLFYELRDTTGLVKSKGSQPILNPWYQDYFGNYVAFSYGEQSKHIDYMHYWNIFLNAAKTKYDIITLDPSENARSVLIEDTYIQMITWNEFIYFLKTCENASREREKLRANPEKYAEFYIAVADLEDDLHEEDPDQMMRILSTGRFDAKLCIETIENFLELSKTKLSIFGL